MKATPASTLRNTDATQRIKVPLADVRKPEDRFPRRTLLGKLAEQARLNTPRYRRGAARREERLPSIGFL